MPHTIFVFDETTCQRVLPVFGNLLLDSFSDAELAMAFSGLLVTSASQVKTRTISRVRSKTTGQPMKQIRRGRVRRPSTFAGYLHLAQRQRAARGESAEAVETVAKGIVEILHSVQPKLVNRRTRPHLWLQNTFCTSDLNTYRRLVWRWCIDGQPPRAQSWSTEARAIRALLRSSIGDEWSADAEAFLQWSEAPKSEGHWRQYSTCTLNVFRFTREDRSVDIHVGTIHSAKGQTHTATLVF